MQYQTTNKERVPYDFAVALKKVGYNQGSEWLYINGCAARCSKVVWEEVSAGGAELEVINAPSIDEALRWLRESKGYVIVPETCVDPDNSIIYSWSVHFPEGRGYHSYDYHNNWDSAMLQAIEYTLNKIIKKNGTDEWNEIAEFCNGMA